MKKRLEHTIETVLDRFRFGRVIGDAAISTTLELLGELGGTEAGDINAACLI